MDKRKPSQEDPHEAFWVLWDISRAERHQTQQDDAIGPLRAIAIALALLLCVPFWLAIGIAVWRHFHGR